jgi:signal transduction histidine kinase
MPLSWAPRDWSIRTKSIAVALGYLLALIALYTAFTWSLLQRESGLAHDRLRQTAALVGAELDTHLESGRQRLALVSALPGMTYGLRTMHEGGAQGRIPPWTTLHYLFFKSPVFTGGTLLLDRDGKVLWTEPPGQSWLGTSLSETSWVRALHSAQRDVLSGRLPPSALLDRPYAVLAYPVRNPDGQLDGVLAGIIDLTAPEFTKILRAVSSSDGVSVMVVDQSGKLLGANRVEGERAEPATFEANENWMSASLSLGQAPWRVVTAQPRHLALAQVWQVQRELLVIGLLLFAVALVSGGPIIRRFLRDVRGLTGAAETMARGDLSKPVPVPPKADEIATLARAFEAMRIELGHSRTALERRLDEREELIRLKEEFLASISHELRTPLNAIIGYTDILLENSELSGEERDYLASIRSQSEHLYQLLSDLLTLSSLNVGRLAVEVSPVHVPALFARLRPLARSLCKDKPVQVEWKCAPTLATIETDPLRLEQILTNLLTNALKFTDRGDVTVTAELLSATEQVEFAVSDTGRGIPEADLAYIFDEFRQVDGSSTRVHGGVGLGLALVKRISELLHGEVNVRSQVGRGSTFIVRLPLRMADESILRQAG